MKTKHTPGPWLAPQEITDNYVWGTKNSTSVVIAKVNVQPSVNPKVVISDVEALANGKLIALAPEMLEALRGSHFFFTGLYDRLVNAGEEEEVLEEVSKTLAAMNEIISKLS